MHQAMGYRYGILIWKSSDDDNDDVSYIAHISQKSESPFTCICVCDQKSACKGSYGNVTVSAFMTSANHPRKSW